MASARLRLVRRTDPLGGALPGAATADALAGLLLADGAIKPAELARLRARQGQGGGPDNLIAGLGRAAGEDRLAAAFARHFDTCTCELDRTPPDVRLIERIGAARCLALGLVPWRRVGGATLVAAVRPDRFAQHRAEIERAIGPARLAVGTPSQVRAAVVDLRGKALVHAAETCVSDAQSCRGARERCWRPVTLMAVALWLLALAAAAPVTVFALLALWAVLTMALTTGLKLAALVAVLRARRSDTAGAADDAPAPAAWLGPDPVVSVIVPLYHERAIALRLIQRLGRLSYPKDRLEVLLAVEEDDLVTRGTLARIDLPHWMRDVVVPAGTLRTKPRALNFVLDFCRGEIIGVYDAEDAPAPDQIECVVAAFRRVPEDVACLQGVLDFYNSRRNWLSRCFTIEYAAWFRVILPGFARLDLVLPLGGTTLFLRRKALEEVGRWDAHNVTEDADLGVRLARHGYRTELIATVTEEEANAWAWPWIRQRSRWLKGYAMTWAVHMRRPGRLWSDLGAWRFFGVQVLFLGTLSQFVLAPVVWSFWLMAFGLPHPLNGAPLPLLITLWGGFIAAEAVNVGVGTLAVADKQHRYLVPWVPTLHFYFPLAALAVVKGLAEVLYRPFYWDKTEHGAFHVAAAPETDPAKVSARV